MPGFLTTNSVFINQVAWRLAAGIAAVAALTGVILTQTTASSSGPRPSPPSSTQLRPAPAAIPSVVSLGGDLDRCIDFCVTHVTTERSFVVFTNGTCVIVDEPCDNPILSAVHTLEDCSDPNARFITRKIENDNYLVSYRRAVFHCLFADEIEAHRPVVEAGFTQYLTSLEKSSMPAGFDPPFDAKLGLVARTRLNQDASDLTVAKVIRARSVAVAPELADPTPHLEFCGPPEPGQVPSNSNPSFQPRIVPPFLPGY